MVNFTLYNSINFSMASILKEEIVTNFRKVNFSINLELDEKEFIDQGSIMRIIPFYLLPIPPVKEHHSGNNSRQF